MKTVVLDTNVLARFLIKDVLDQYIEAERIFNQVEAQKIQAKVSILVINELIWVLENYYEIDRKVFIDQLLYLLALRNIGIIEVKKSLVVKILERMKTSTIDFTDYYLTMIAAGGQIVSFDKDIKRIGKLS